MWPKWYALSYELPYIILQVITGNLFWEGSFTRNEVGTMFQFTFKQTLAHAPNFLFIWRLLWPISNGTITIVKSEPNPQRKFVSRAMALFNW